MDTYIFITAAIWIRYGKLKPGMALTGTGFVAGRAA